MLLFAVFDGDKPAESFGLYHAHLVGANSVGMPGDIAFADGLIRCEKRGPESAGLALMVDAAPWGHLLMQTCLLPDRESPYLLHIELARHKLKSFLVKIEDWMLFEVAPDHPVLVQWQTAQDLFTQALLIERTQPANADALGRAALLKAIEAGENLTFMHADSLLAKRFAQSDVLAPPSFGCRIHQSQFAEPLTAILARDFEFISMPIRWRELEPEEGEYDWTKFDRWMEWAEKSRFPVMLGPIIDFRQLAVPEWLYIWEHDYDTVYDLLYEHIEAIVKRYRRVVTVWNVASSLHINESFTLAYDQLMDLTRMATTHVKKLHPAGRTLVEITEPFGEYFATNQKSVPPIVYAEMLAQSGFKLDLIGINLQFGNFRTGQATRDFLQIGSIIDELMHLEMPVIVTGVGVPSGRPKLDRFDPAGFYREPWSPASQVAWLRKMISIAVSRTFVEAVCVHEFFDHAAPMLPGAGLINGAGRPKPSLAAMGDIREGIAHRTLRCTSPDERVWVRPDTQVEPSPT